MAGVEDSVSNLSSPEEARWAAAYRDGMPNATAETMISIFTQRKKLLFSSESY